MPWVRGVARDIPDFWERAVVVSRGGMGRLYHPDVETVDLYSLRSVDEVAAENRTAKDELGVNKPVRQTEWELDVSREVSRQYAVGSWHHPRGMCAVLMPYWEGKAGLLSAAAHLDISLIEKPPKPDWLPERYTAVKWYHREGKYDRDVIREWLQIVDGLEDRGTVMWVGDGSGYDRHIDGTNRFCLSMPPGPAEDNLYRQAQVIAHAEKFVGTYGGTAQLALRLGVPTVCFYPGREPRHRAWNQWVAHQTGVPFVSGSLCELPLMRSVLG
jgi:hypothetical protein